MRAVSARSRTSRANTGKTCKSQDQTVSDAHHPLPFNRRGPRCRSGPVPALMRQAAARDGFRQAERLRFGSVTKIHDLTVLELAAAIRGRELSPVEITAHYLDRIDALNADVGAFYTVTADAARDQAAEAEKAVARVSDPAALPPLTGVPIPIKDLNMVAGVRQTLGSLVYEDNVPAIDDHVSAALRAAGAVLTGKTATFLFSEPASTE